MLCNFVLIELPEVEGGFLDGQVIEVGGKLLDFSINIEHILIVKQIEIIFGLFFCGHFKVDGVFLQFSDDMHFCGISLEELLLVTGYSIEELMDIESGDGGCLVLSGEVEQSQQMFIHLLQDSNKYKHFKDRIIGSTMQQQQEQPIEQIRKKIKQNEQDDDNEGWIVVKKKDIPLTVSICDYNKVNRFYSHKSLQNYIRYILVQTVPNPMWLSIKRQSLIQRIIYIDVEIQNNLFEKMVANKQLAFLATLGNESNIAKFKGSNKIFRQDLWQCLLSYQRQENIQEIASNKSIEQPIEINQELYQKYLKFTLTPQQLKTHLYPNKQLPIYQHYYQPVLTNNSKDIKNCILIIDCEMVVSQAGFELARTTIINFEGQTLFDQLFKPQVQIINYNTQYSGITKEILDPVVNTIQNKLHPFLDTLLCDRTILVGHSLENDLRAMKLIHNTVIDSSVLYMRKNGTKLKLKSLADKILNRKIQSGSHDSLEDCLATLHLIRARIESNETTKKKEYDLLKEMSLMGKKAAIIDYAVDYEMKEFNANHFEKIQRYEEIQNIFGTTQKYLKKDVCIPELILTRIEKHPKIDWCEYYQNFDAKLKDFYAQIPKMSLVFINCQVNPHIQILSAGQTLKGQSGNRSPCFILGI